MSTYNNSADQAELQLNNISKTMCYAKWAQSSMQLTNGMTHSCYHPPLHVINVEDIKRNPKALHNTEQKKQERKLMLEGKRPQGCSYCWKIEDVGGRSDRIYRSGEYWAQNARLDIFDALDTGDVDPRYLEVNFNQACNFKCMYCSPHLSTAWEDEIKKYNAYDILDANGNTTKHNDVDYMYSTGSMPLKVKQEDNPYLEAFWKWWPELYRKLEVFRITGGEPLMDANTFRVLDYIYENPNAWLEISITSNLCPPKPELFNKFIEKVKKLEEVQIWEDKARFNPGAGNHWYVNMAVKHFSLFVSLDSVDEQAEYIRFGLDYKIMKNNVYEVLANTNNTAITFINTYSALSVPKTKEFMMFILKLRQDFSKDAQGIKNIQIHDPYTKHPDYVVHPTQRVWFDIPLLRSPQWQNIQILDESFETYLEDAISFMKQHIDTSNFVGFYDFEIEKVERNLKILRETRYTGAALKLHRENFVSFFKQYDERKGTSFTKTFPEFNKQYYV